MENNTPLNPLGQKLVQMLNATAGSVTSSPTISDTVHVSGTGAVLSHAYEQLRNAAEYTEEHLLVAHAIRRFYTRIFASRNEQLVAQSGEDLVVELTLAGYIENDSISYTVVDTINQLASEFYSASDVHRNDDWTIAVLAVEVELIFSNDLKRAVFAQIAYEHFLSILKNAALSDSAHYEILLFIAVQRALLKADDATIRAALLQRYGIKPHDSAFKQTNELIDSLLSQTDVDKLVRVIRKRGAPFRILWRFIDDRGKESIQLLLSRERFLTAYEDQIVHEYSQINQRIDAGIIKSILFLIITKSLIGVGVEVPYDLLVHDKILWLPLIVNLFFPPVYMLLLRMTLRLPGDKNTRSLVESIDAILYGTHAPVSASNRMAASQSSSVFNAIYSLVFLLLISGLTWLLVILNFTVIAIIIFFIFFSTASFLGFRLSRQIRELEVVDQEQDGVSIVRDFIYIPFAAVGAWISEKYARVNVVAMVLDMVIELPLKTVLHLLRQWTVFIASKKDEL